MFRSIPRRSCRNDDLIEELSGLMVIKGCPAYLRSDNGMEFTAKKLRQWLSNVGVITAYIEPDRPWENRYCESYNARMRVEFLNRVLFGNLNEAQVMTIRWIDY